MSRFITIRRLLPLLLLGALGLGLAGCGDSERTSTAAELDDPAYLEGKSLLKTGRKQEALNSFLKVIDKRGDDAPESHLEVGLLYQQDINDPLSAIYHFKKYLALRPNGPLSAQVKQRIDAAMRDFAGTLPAQPIDKRVDLVAALDRLKQENEMLKQELADLKAGRGNASVGLPGENTPAATSPPVPGGFNFPVESIPTVRTRPVPAASVKPAPARHAPAVSPAKPAPATAAATRPAGGKRHTIAPGDTLSKLAQQYYGNRARWRDIYAANRDVMKSETDLKTGMVLKIP